MSEVDNLPVFDADRRGVYEVWYTTWNDPATGEGYWLRYIIERPVAGHGVPTFGDERRGELWFARFDPRDASRTFGIHRRFRDVSSSDSPFAVNIASAKLTNVSASGMLRGNDHLVRWELRWEPSPTTLRFFPDAMYRSKLSSSLVNGPNHGVPLSGVLVVDGETINVDRAVASQSHVWATKHTHRWTWAHCHELEGAPGATLELLAGILKRGRVTLPPMAGVSLVLDGELHRFNQLRHLPINRCSITTTKVTFTAGGASMRLEGSFTASPEKILNCPYIDPDGEELWCANTEIADATVTVFRRSGLRWLEHRRLVSRGRAHYEVGGRERDPAVATPHVLVA
ncbi:MAG TPA: hypothetical protein VGM39_17905 [Kofleriaceae bacterium]